MTELMQQFIKRLREIPEEEQWEKLVKEAREEVGKGGRTRFVWTGGR